MKPRAMAAHRWSRHALPRLYLGCWRNAAFRRAYKRAWMRAQRGQPGDFSPPHQGVRDGRRSDGERRQREARDANLYAWRPAGFVCRAETTEGRVDGC